MRPISVPRLVDQAELVDRMKHFGPKVFRAYLDLSDFYWRYGKLLPDEHDLADICRVHIQSFRRMRAQLDILFETDDSGRWRDYELEEERAEALRKSAVRSGAGAAGARTRWAKGAVDGVEEPSPAMANGMANAIAHAIAVPAETAPNGMANGMAAPASRGSIDLSISLETSEDIDLSISRARAGEAGAGLANGMANAIAHATAVPAETAPNGMANGGSGSPHYPPEPMANAMAIATPFAIAAGLGAGLEAAAPNGAASGNGAHPPADTVAPRDGPSNRVLIDLVRGACGGNVEPAVLCSKEMRPLRALIGEGYDLEREILPVLRRVVHMRSPLKTFRGGWIREEMDDHRREARDEADATGPPAPPKVFVAVDTPEWRAWQDYARLRGRAGYPSIQRDSMRGWEFATPWPPDDATAAAE